AKGLPLHEASAKSWVGVSFLTGHQVLLTPLDEVLEIMRVPQLAPIPGVKSWLRGMVTSHGELFPVTDLNGFLTGKVSALTSYSRILVIKSNEGTSGILVDRVLGLQRIDYKEMTKEVANPPSEIASFITGAIMNEHLSLPIISCIAIMKDPKFRDVAQREIELSQVKD
ncbi:MAG: chemotaxis protein CheW, partial [Candidatus Berkiella sp.]